ncbi:MAG TPA: glycogen/starch synthase, partial [Candidatus Omnitrophota bacterium]|nr:glycogen/starch synthase [Candidatus Omnitrophota bacterium]
IAEITLPYKHHKVTAQVYKRVNASGIRDYFIESEIFSFPYDKSDISNPEGAVKETVVYNAVSALLILMGETRPDVLFLADWQSGLILSYFAESFDNDFAFLHKAVIRTPQAITNGYDLMLNYRQANYRHWLTPIAWINNEAYRGQFRIANKDHFTWETGLVSERAFEHARWITPGHGQEMSAIFLKLLVETVAGWGGSVITVSENYANEIMGVHLFPGHYPGMLHGILNRIGVKGVLNGTPSEWKYVERLEEKDQAKQALLAELNMASGADQVLSFMISRLVSQKGVSLFIDGTELIAQMLRDFPEAVLIIGGKVESRWREAFEGFKERLEREFPSRVRVSLSFLPLKMVEDVFKAGDWNLFPSLYEPAGTLYKGSVNMVLTVARLTGGLIECAQEIDLKEGRGNSVTFSDFTPEAFVGAWRRALEISRDKRLLKAIQQSAPATAKTWDDQAKKYFHYVKVSAAERRFFEGQGQNGAGTNSAVLDQEMAKGQDMIHRRDTPPQPVQRDESGLFMRIGESLLSWMKANGTAAWGTASPDFARIAITEVVNISYGHYRVQAYPVADSAFMKEAAKLLEDNRGQGCPEPGALG